MRAATIADLTAAGEHPDDVADWYDLTAQETDQTVHHSRGHLRIP